MYNTGGMNRASCTEGSRGGGVGMLHVLQAAEPDVAVCAAVHVPLADVRSAGHA